MKLDDLTTVEQLEDFLSGTQSVAFAVISDKDAGYRWIQGELARFGYLTCPRQHKGVLIRYLMKVSGYSRQQRTVTGFARRYTVEDICLLAAMDERHETPCGPAVKKLCERAYGVFGQAEYERLATISVSHLYNLRRSVTYTRQGRHFCWPVTARAAPDRVRAKRGRIPGSSAVQ